MVVGTEEEIRIAGGTEDVIAAIRRIRSLTSAVIVIKRGASGCVIVPAAVIGHETGRRWRVVFGPPVEATPGRSEAPDAAAGADMVAHRVRELLDTST